jgi:hypothetical protein
MVQSGGELPGGSSGDLSRASSRCSGAAQQGGGGGDLPRTSSRRSGGPVTGRRGASSQWRLRAPRGRVAAFCIFIFLFLDAKVFTKLFFQTFFILDAKVFIKFFLPKLILILYATVFVKKFQFFSKLSLLILFPSKCFHALQFFSLGSFFRKRQKKSTKKRKKNGRKIDAPP